MYFAVLTPLGIKRTLETYPGGVLVIGRHGATTLTRPSPCHATSFSAVGRAPCDMSRECRWVLYRFNYRQTSNIQVLAKPGLTLDLPEGFPIRPLTLLITYYYAPTQMRSAAKNKPRLSGGLSCSRRRNISQSRPRTEPEPLIASNRKDSEKCRHR